MQLAKLAKLARGVASMDEALEMLSAMGVEVEVSPANGETHKGLDAVLLDGEADNGIRGCYRVDLDLKGLHIRAIVVVSNPSAEVIEALSAEAAHAPNPA